MLEEIERLMNRNPDLAIVAIGLWLGMLYAAVHFAAFRKKLSWRKHIGRSFAAIAASEIGAWNQIFSEHPPGE
jgi:hypothetical protein